MGLNLSIVVVLYKKHYEKSIALKTLLQSEQAIIDAGFTPTIYVWNNSPGFSPKLKHDRVVWLEGENDYLSSIYNKIADISFSGGSDILMLSDDDTNYNRFNFKENLNIIKEITLDNDLNNAIGCFIPKILSNDIIVSPAGRFFCKGYLLRSSTSGSISSKNIVGINSGIFITKKCFEKMQPFYNERLHFYGTDTDFFIRYEKIFSRIYVFECVIEHSLSEHTIETIERVLFRWRDIFYALRIIFINANVLYRFFVGLYILCLKIKLSIKYSTLKFFI